MYNGLLSQAIYEEMVRTALDTIQTTFGLDPKQCDLISGGAAWSDHVAVTLFNRGDVHGLTIYAPCLFSGNKFVDNNQSKDWRVNPGYISNLYHGTFSAKIGGTTLLDIHDAQTKGAVIDTKYPGFHKRDGVIASTATHMIAFSWSDTGAPSDGGTFYTWNRCHLPLATHKIHINLKEICDRLGIVLPQF